MIPFDAHLDEAQVVFDVSLPDYGQVSFLEYPRKYPNYKIPQNYTTAFSLARYGSTMGQPLLERFLQTWLFFGLLKETLGTTFHHDAFVKDRNDEIAPRRILSTTRLNYLLQVWTGNVQTDTRYDHRVCQHLYNCLQITKLALTAAGGELDPTVKFVLGATAETLVAAVDMAFKLKGILLSRPSELCSWSFFDDSIARYELMKRNSWCIAQASTELSRYNSLDAHHYLGHLRKPTPEQDHTNCLSTTCLAMQVDPASYKPQHTKHECRCEIVHIEQAVLCEMLAAGSTPLLSLKIDPVSDEISASLMPFDGKAYYVALSHVWADGLGDPSANAMPSCQLRRILDLLGQFEAIDRSEMETSAPFLWIDTLCCPAKLSEGKTLALGRMASTYQNAAHVLILESSLYNTDYITLQRLEILARVFTSSWMHRLWTLQEAYLARRLWIQFKDGMVDLDEIADSFIRESRDPASDMLYCWFRCRIDEIRSMRKSASSLLYRLALAFKLRSVSERSDEALCIGTYLGLDVETIARISKDGDTRMREMWSLFGKRHNLPKNIIHHRGPKLTARGFGWAPQTMLACQIAAFFDVTAETVASLSTEGLFFSSNAFSVSIALRSHSLTKPSSSLILDADDFLMDEVGHWYILRSEEESLYEKVASTDADYTILLRNLVHDNNVHEDGLFVKTLGIRLGVHHIQGSRQIKIRSLGIATTELMKEIMRQSRLLREDTISRNMTEAREYGENDPRYIEARGRFIEKFKVVVKQLFDSLDDETATNTMGSLGFNARHGERVVFGLLSRFYRGRYLLMGPIVNERYCLQ